MNIHIPDEVSDAFEIWRGGIEDGYTRYPLKHIDAFNAGAKFGREEGIEVAAQYLAPFSNDMANAIRALVEGADQ